MTSPWMLHCLLFNKMSRSTSLFVAGGHVEELPHVHERFVSPRTRRLRDSRFELARAMPRSRVRNAILQAAYDSKTSRAHLKFVSANGVEFFAAGAGADLRVLGRPSQ